jgi:GT2 family glycosyltransferase
MYPRVAIIILNWNGWENTIECLESLFNINYPNYYIILVDNDSDDNSIIKIMEYCRGKISPESNYFKYNKNNKPIKIKKVNYDEIKTVKLEKDYINLPNKEKNIILLENDKNYGFAEGNNIAIRFVMKNLDPEYLLLLNNDTVVDNRFLTELINVAIKNVDIGFVGPKIYEYDKDEISKTISFAGGNLNNYTSQPHPIGAGQLDKTQYDSDRQVDYVEGSCILIKKDLIKQVGLLDKEYFTYWEEIDWCIRGQKKGFKSFYSYKSIIWHKGYASDLSANSIYYMIKNRFLYINKNADSKQIIISSLYYYCYYLWIILFSSIFIKRNKNNRQAILKGTIEGIKILR